LGEAFDDPDGIVVIDDTGFAKNSHHSVGVARQYSGTLGKTDNCQIAVSLQYATPRVTTRWHYACTCQSY
jgi:SRSO17 transposase